MTWVATTLSFRAAVLLGFPSLAGRGVRVAVPGGDVWCGNRRLGRVRRPADCRVAGGLPVGRARRLRAERRQRRQRAAWPDERIVWGGSGGQTGAGFGREAVARERILASARALDHEVVWWRELRHDGHRLGVVVAPWSIGRELVVADLEVVVLRPEFEVREVRHPAECKADGRPVVWLAGRAGCVAVEHCGEDADGATPACHLVSIFRDRWIDNQRDERGATVAWLRRLQEVADMEEVTNGVQPRRRILGDLEGWIGEGRHIEGPGDV